MVESSGKLWIEDFLVKLKFQTSAGEEKRTEIVLVVVLIQVLAVVVSFYTTEFSAAPSPHK